MKALSIIATIAMAGSIALLAGCQTPGKLVSLKDSSVCPKCRTETQTTALKGLNISKHLCPTCETEYEFAYTYIGDLQQAREAVHTCTTCGALVENCRRCINLADQSGASK